MVSLGTSCKPTLSPDTGAFGWLIRGGAAGQTADEIFESESDLYGSNQSRRLHRLSMQIYNDYTNTQE